MKSRAIVLAVALPLVAGAKEVTPGTLELSGATGLELGSTRTEIGSYSYDESRRGLEARAVWYAWRNVGVGALASYERRHAESAVSGSSSFFTTSTVRIGPTAGVFYGVGERVALFGNVAVLAIRSSDERGYWSVDTGGATDRMTADGWGWQAGAGVSLFATDAVAFQAGLRYEGRSIDDGGRDRMHVRDLSASVGVAFFLFGK